MEKKGKKWKEGDSMINKTADELLQHSLMLFPMVLPDLVKKSSIQMNILDEDNITVDISQHAIFVDNYCPPSLKHLSTLYVERNYVLWKDPKVTN
jgi:hypothetical protein